MVQITKSIIMGSYVELHTSDGKVVTVSLCTDRIYVGVSSGDSGLILTPSQHSCNSVDIHYGREPDPPIMLAGQALPKKGRK